MVPNKKRAIAAVVTVLALLCGAIAVNERRPTLPVWVEPPFKFTRHPGGPGNGTDVDSRNDPTGLAGFTSNIPIIVLRTASPEPVSNTKDYSACRVEVYEPSTNGPARLNSPPTLATAAGLRLHGMVSRLFPKLSYKLKLLDESGNGQKQPLLGMPSDANWVLQGPWLDKSLIRNAFSYDLARGMGCEAMRTRPCEVFLHASDGSVSEADYIGVYQLTEHIERGADRVNVTKLASDENAEPAITGGYILAWDAGQGNYLPTWRTIQLRYPKQPSSEQISWIDREFTRFDKALKGADFRDSVKGYAAHIEIDDWINYILFEEQIFNLDGYTRSFYLQKDRGGKIRPGPVWDHDLALGHQFQNGTSFDTWWYLIAGRHGWIARLTSDPAFEAKMAKRWRELRQGPLSDSQIDTRVDSIAKPLLDGAAERNFERWKILDVQRPSPKPIDYITIATTYPDQITALKKFLHERAGWMDAHLAAD